VGDPVQMSSILEALEDSSHVDGVSAYAARIGERVGELDLSDFWSSALLIEHLLDSGVDEARRVGSALSHAIYEQCSMELNHLAYFLCIIRSAEGELFQDGIQRLRLLLETVDDVTDVISIRPLIANLRSLGEKEAHRELLGRVSNSIDTLSLGTSYAPLELISVLRMEGLHTAADALSVRVALEYDPVLSGAAAHALKYVRKLMPRDAFESFSNRMANTGPILPVADAEKLADCFAELGKNMLRQTYLQRLHEFRAAEGY
jgi:hypothetical protein